MSIVIWCHLPCPVSCSVMWCHVSCSVMCHTKCQVVSRTQPHLIYTFKYLEMIETITCLRAIAEHGRPLFFTAYLSFFLCFAVFNLTETGESTTSKFYLSFFLIIRSIIILIIHETFSGKMENMVRVHFTYAFLDSRVSCI